MIGIDTADYLKAWGDEGISFVLAGKDAGSLKAGGGDIDALGLVTSTISDIQSSREKSKTKTTQLGLDSGMAGLGTDMNPITDFDNSGDYNEGLTIGDLSGSDNNTNQDYNKAYAKAGLYGVSFSNANTQSDNAGDDGIGGGLFDPTTNIALDNENEKPVVLVEGSVSKNGAGGITQAGIEYLKGIANGYNNEAKKITGGGKVPKTSKKVDIWTSDYDPDYEEIAKLEQAIDKQLELLDMDDFIDDYTEKLESVVKNSKKSSKKASKIVNKGQIVLHNTGSDPMVDALSANIAARIVDIKDKPYSNYINFYLPGADRNFPSMSSIVPVGAGHGNNLHPDNSNPLKAADCSGGARYAINKALQAAGYKPIPDGGVNAITPYFTPVFSYEQDSSGNGVSRQQMESYIKQYAKPGYIIVWGDPNKNYYSHINVYQGTKNNRPVIFQSSSKQRPGYPAGRNISEYPVRGLLYYYAGDNSQKRYKLMILKIDKNKLRRS